MKNPVTHKILQITVAVSFFSQSVVYPEHIFDVSGESSNFARDQLQYQMKRGRPTATIVDDEADPDWDLSWENEPDVVDESDIETFFPVADRNNPQPPKTESPAQKQYRSDPDQLFHIGENSSNALTPIQKVVSQSAQSSDEKDDWTLDSPEPRRQADISTVKQNPPTVYHTAQKAAPAPVWVNETKQKTAPTTLGTQTIAVDPYITPQDSVAKKSPQKQSHTAHKAPFTPTSTQKRGVFGPHTRKTIKRPDDDQIIAQIDPMPTATGQRKTPPKTILINFNNVSIIEYIRFISRITNKNFVFDEKELQFNVTIISEEPTTIENVMTALIQELRIHGLLMIEQGNNLIIHRNSGVNSISRINVNGSPKEVPRESEIVTQVFRLNTLDPDHARRIIGPLVSKQALIEISKETRHIIITDIVTNINQVELLFKSIDAPNSGLVIGQYVVRNAFMDTLIELAEKIMEPIAKGQPLKFIPHPAAKSIFIVSSPLFTWNSRDRWKGCDDFFKFQVI